MRILAISHSAVVGDYQERFAEVARHPDLDLTLLVPKRWRQFNRKIELEKRSDPRYRIVARQPLTWGLRRHGLRNVAHLYTGMGRLLDAVRPDIVEIWEEPFSAVTARTLFLVRRRLPDAKVIFFSAQNLSRSFPPPFSLFERFTLRNADFAFLMNGDVEGVLRRKGYGGGGLILPLGVDPARFRRMEVSDLRRELGLKRFTVGFVGKMDAQKGVLDLVEACVPLGEEVDLLLIGTGPLDADVRTGLEKRGLEGAARLLAPVPHGRLAEYLNCMDVLVLPSRTLKRLKEQFGRILIEAMACGVPVIGSDSGEIPRVIGEAGLVFPEGNVRALTAAVRSLKDDPARAGEFARKGRERVEEAYTWTAIAKSQVAVYHRLLEGSASGVRSVERERE